jgi:hypothetical protein
LTALVLPPALAAGAAGGVVGVYFFTAGYRGRVDVLCVIGHLTIDGAM